MHILSFIPLSLSFTLACTHTRAHTFGWFTICKQTVLLLIIAVKYRCKLLSVFFLSLSLLFCPHRSSSPLQVSDEALKAHSSVTNFFLRVCSLLLFPSVFLSKNLFFSSLPPYPVSHAVSHKGYGASAGGKGRTDTLLLLNRFLATSPVLFPSIHFVSSVLCVPLVASLQVSCPSRTTQRRSVCPTPSASRWSGKTMGRHWAVRRSIPRWLSRRGFDIIAWMWIVRLRLKSKSVCLCVCVCSFIKTLTIHLSNKWSNKAFAGRYFVKHTLFHLFRCHLSCYFSAIHYCVLL